jgi:DNA-binding response OmpR family regulator
MSLSSGPGHYGNVRVLVVEDHKVLADRIAEGLRDQGMAVDVAYDGEAALESTAVTGYDVIVLDRDLPRVHGDAVCASLVTGSAQARILMLTAAAAVGDRVDGLNLGADDYLGKPFAFTELVARVRALGRRSPSAPPVLFSGDLAIDRVRRRVSRGGRPVILTRKEFGVLGGTGRGRRRRGQRRGPARAGVGRERRPVHPDGDGHHRPAQAQARRARPH